MNKLALYQSALRVLLDVPEDDRYTTGLCHVLTEAISLKRYGLTYHQLNQDNTLFLPIWYRVHNGVWGINNEMPEISRHAPEDRLGLGYWPITYDDRVKILEDAIEELKHVEDDRCVQSLSEEEVNNMSQDEYEANHWDGDSSVDQ